MKQSPIFFKESRLVFSVIPFERNSQIEKPNVCVSFLKKDLSYRSHIFLLILFQIVDFDTNDMVIPAPVVKKPYDYLTNPYPTSCSRLCNHPVSKELKQEYQDVLKKTKDSHVCYTFLYFSDIAISSTLHYNRCVNIILGRKWKDNSSTR